MREQYTALWAHSFAEERVALRDFLDIVDAAPGRSTRACTSTTTRRTRPRTCWRWPRATASREAEVDRLLREGVFVDLYPIVRRALRVGSRSYSIKKLEPLYMGAEVRTSDVQKGDDSIVQYVEARALADDGDDGRGAGDPRRPRRLQPLRLRLDPAPARLARRACARGRAAPRRRIPSRTSGAYEPSPLPMALRPARGCEPRRRADERADRRCASGAAGDRLLPARGEDLLGDALPAAARAGVDVGVHARRRRVWTALAAASRSDWDGRRAPARIAASSSCAASWRRARG